MTKTEVVLLGGPLSITSITLEIDGATAVTSSSLKYLSVHFGKHEKIRCGNGKPENTIMAIYRLASA